MAIFNASNTSKPRMNIEKKQQCSAGYKDKQSLIY